MPIVERNAFIPSIVGVDNEEEDYEDQSSIEIEIEGDGDDSSVIIAMDEDTAALMAAEQDHYINIAQFLDQADLVRIGQNAVDQYEADKSSREEWESTFERGFDLLGLKLKETSEPFEGACTAVHPILIESAVKFQSKASNELFPAVGPVKTEIMGKLTPEKEEQANRVQNFMNYQVTEQMSEFFDEFERMLFHLPLIGSAFKKIYYDMNKERPVSEFVPVDHFFVSYNATDLMSANRYTHVIYRTPNDLRKDIEAGMYIDPDNGLPEPQSPQLNGITSKIDEIMGRYPSEEYDNQYVLLEQHCYLDLPEPFNNDNGVADPYILTVEESSGQVLCIRRNWQKDDPKREKLTHFTHYKFVPGFGFYGLGLMHFLGNLTMSATAALRNLIDAGQFANLPGGFKARGVRVVGNNDPIAPGEFREVEATGMDLNKAIVHNPYREPSQTLYNMMDYLTKSGQKFADSTEQVINDSTNYGPVGTTMALLEASSKFFSAIHKRLHNSQKNEFRILARINFEYLPDEYPYDGPGEDLSIMKSDFDGRVDVVPVSDPNTPSSAHRLAMAQLLLQMASQSPPGLYNMREIHRSVLNAANIQHVDRYLIPEEEPVPQDPVSDIQSVVLGKPIKAFPQQDHEAHINVKQAFIQDPVNGQNEIMQNVVPVLVSNIREHMILKYQEEMSGLIQEGRATQQQVNEQGMGMLMSEAANKILQANQLSAQGGPNTLEMQNLKLQEQDLQLKEQKMQLEASSNTAELALKNRELDIKEQGQTLDLLEETGKRTERDMERDLKALKEAGQLSVKQESSIRDSNTKMAIEAMRNLIREQELLIKKQESDLKKSFKHGEEITSSAENETTEIINELQNMSQGTTDSEDFYEDPETAIVQPTEIETVETFEDEDEIDVVENQEVISKTVPENEIKENELPRGIKNNNPGNIIKTSDEWEGMSEDQGDSTYVQFDEAKWGLRALAKNLINQKRFHGIDNVESLISKYAPSSENPTSEYITFVSNKLSVDPQEAIDLSDESVLKDVMKAVIEFENGVQPYSSKELDEGIMLATEKIE